MAIAEAGSRRSEVMRDVHVVGTLSFAHFFSHFYQFTLPLLFPAMEAEYQVGFARLGLLVAIFFGCSGVAQTAAGFVVDRIGPPRVLAAGLGLLAASMALIALAPSFWLMFPAAALAGIGNSVFHPADYSIMSRRVGPARIGKAFAVHNLSGTIGYAAAPLAMLTLTARLGWHAALLVGALAGGVGFLVVLARQGLLAGPRRNAQEGVAAPATAAIASPFAALRHPAVLVCFSFFLLMAVPTVGLSGFLATTLRHLFGTPLAATAAALTVYLAGSALGVMLGGVLADRLRQPERIVATSVACSAAIILAVGLAGFGPLLLAGFLAVAGFCNGLAAPSRDMLVRSAAAASATGKVFGFAYSGFDLGSALAPPLLGILVDSGHDALVLPTVSLCLVLVILSALRLRHPLPG